MEILLINVSVMRFAGNTTAGVTYSSDNSDTVYSFYSVPGSGLVKLYLKITIALED